MDQEQQVPTKRGEVLYLAYISRAIVKAERQTLFVFGDNMIRRGFGGQAAQMRGEPNAIGIPTKWYPSDHAEAYFINADWADPSPVREAILAAFVSLAKALYAGRNVVIPADGIGTGLAQLPTRAPVINEFIKGAIAQLEAIAAGTALTAPCCSCAPPALCANPGCSYFGKEAPPRTTKPTAVEGKVYNIRRTDIEAHVSFPALFFNGWFWPLRDVIHPSRTYILGERRDGRS